MNQVLRSWITIDKINWKISNNPAAIHLLEANFNKINWTMLSMNSEAMHLLEANPDKIDWNNDNVIDHYELLHVEM